jgi:mono/diheme cytochrome c family protein
MNRLLKWLGAVLGALVVIALVAAAALYVIGGSKYRGPNDLPAENISITADSATLAWGEHLVVTHGCKGCHLDGLQGQVLVDAPPFRAVASNLTEGQGGVGARLDAQGWERAVRHGVGIDGRGLFFMPSEFYDGLSDQDVAAIVAFIQTMPPVDNELPATQMKPLGRILAGTGAFGPASGMIDHGTPHRPTTPPVAATLEYGRYRGEIMCVACHGPNLEGAPSPDPQGMPAPSLVPVGDWTLEQFRTALRTGVTPAGRAINPDAMPWNMLGTMTDEELAAIHLYIQDVAGASGASPH